MQWVKRTRSVYIIILLAIATESFAQETTPLHQAPPFQALQDTLHSRALNKSMPLNIYLPPGYTDQIDYPVIYLFHGWGGNQDSWSQGVGVDRVVVNMMAQGRIRPVILVLPHLDNSNGLNSAASVQRLGDDPAFSPYKGIYEDYIRYDLIQYIDTHFSTIPTAAGRAIGGDSMGGFEALHIAFRNPHLFSRVGGFQPAMWPDDMPAQVKAFLYPDRAIRKERDPIELARVRDLSGLAVYLDCGAEDDVKPGTQTLYEILQEKEIPAQFHVTPGGHTLERLAAHVEDYLLFLAGP
ncbi:MAG: esterase [Candidatus Latescibacteria bacterium]|nr:esterase [Candidatus Latescibacterota bacterium]